MTGPFNIFNTKIRDYKDQGLLYCSTLRLRSFGGLNLAVRMYYKHVVRELYFGISDFDVILRDLLVVSLMNGVGLRNGNIAAGHG